MLGGVVEERRVLLDFAVLRLERVTEIRLAADLRQDPACEQIRPSDAAPASFAISLVHAPSPNAEHAP